MSKEYTEHTEYTEYTKDFVLDYEVTKRKLTRVFRKAVQEGVYEDAFQDTYADYLELHDTIPVTLGHLVWFKYRMWNNVNMYPPFVHKVRAKNGGYDETRFIGDCISDLDIMQDDNSQDPEFLLMCRQEIEQEMMLRYPVRKNEPDVVKFLRQGYTTYEAADLAGCTQQNAHVYHLRGVRRANEYRDKQQQSNDSSGRPRSG